MRKRTTCLTLCEMSRIEVGPALGDSLVGDAPDNDTAEFELLVGLRVGGRPMVTDNHLSSSAIISAMRRWRSGNFFKASATY
jgi:hypothetical protein